MESAESSNPARKRTARDYYPWWLDRLADDVTGEGAAMQGALQGAENVRRLVEYTCQIQGEPTSVVVTVKRNAQGKAQHLVVNHRPRSSVLLFARLMGKKYAGTPFAEYFITSEPEPTSVDVLRVEGSCKVHRAD
jgi:hypothetical protein